MKADLFAFLPSEIVIHILSRLPVRTIISCKCVCKSWLALLETRDFVEAHLHNAVPGLAVYRYWAKLYKIFEFEDELDVERHELHYRSVTKFNLSYSGWIGGSTNGLLFLCNTGKPDRGLYVCNPITRDYVTLDGTQDFIYSIGAVVTFGFGVSKISGQYKVVSIFQHYVNVPDRHHRVPESECVCHVYTIGTGLWRRIPPVTNLVFSYRTIGAFVNGNLHWLVTDLKDTQLFISCFDLETELFSTFTSPILGSNNISVGLSTLGDYLCLCDNSSNDEIQIWLMKEYGVEKSWIKQLNICSDPAFHSEYSFEVVYPIKVFNDGDILMAWEHDFLFYYSKKNQTVQKIDVFEPHSHINAFFHTPSFLSLKGFEMENVTSF